MREKIDESDMKSGGTLREGECLGCRIAGEEH